MTILKAKKNTTPSLEEGMKEQAKAHGISFEELKKMYEGKECPKYGTSELLHVRKVKGGKLVVFNISDKFRSEKISEGRKALSKKNS